MDIIIKYKEECFTYTHYHSSNASRALSDALRQLLNCLPGQIEFEQALRSLQEATKMLEAKKVNHKVYYLACDTTVHMSLKMCP